MYNYVTCRLVSEKGVCDASFVAVYINRLYYSILFNCTYIDIYAYNKYMYTCDYIYRRE